MTDTIDVSDATLPQAEQDAVKALFAAADGLVPFGYFVGCLGPEDVKIALWDEEELSDKEAGECLIRWESQLVEYLMQGEYLRDLLRDLRQDPLWNSSSELDAPPPTPI